jgi:hypothetical protein
MTEIAFVPSMAGLSNWFTATRTATIRGSGGVTITAGGAVYEWQNQGAITSSALPMGASGAAGTVVNAPVYAGAAINAIQGLQFNGTTNRLGTATGAVQSGQAGGFLVLCRMRGASISYPVSHSGGNYATLLQASATRDLSAYAAAGVFASFVDDEAMLLLGSRPTSNSGTGVGRKNGSEAIGVPGAATNVANARLILGNRYAGTTDAMDGELFEVMEWENDLSRTNQHRLEGWVAHTYGLAVLLPATHPYKANPPMVPSGTTSTVGWNDVNLTSSGEAQIISGLGVELQSAALGANNEMLNVAGGIPFDLVASERARFASEMLGYGHGFRYWRWASALHAMRGVSPDGKNLIEQFTAGTPVGTQISASEGQNTILLALKQAAESAIGGGHVIELDYENWTEGTYFKVGNKLSAAKLNNPSKSTDPSGYAAWVDDLTTSELENLQYADAAGFRIGMYSFQNEAGNPAVTTYSHTIFTPSSASDKELYLDIWTSLIPKIRAASFVNSDASAIRLHANSWDGPNGFAMAQLKAAPIWPEFYAISEHRISLYSSDANNIPTYTIAQRSGTGGNAGVMLPVMDTEFEYFDAVRDNIIATYGADAEPYMLSNSALKVLHCFTKNGAATDFGLIHAGKPTYDGGDSLGYAMTFWKSPYNTANMTGQSRYDSLATGYWDVWPTNWNAIAGFLKYMPWDCQRWVISSYAAMPTGTAAMAWTEPTTGKISFVVVNRTATPFVFHGFVGGLKTLTGHRFTVAAADAALGSTTVTVLQTTVAAYSVEFWTEI